MSAEDKKEKIEATVTNKIEEKKDTAIGSIDDMFDEVPTVSVNDEQVDVQQEEDSYDLQKELEAKFDELFGPMDD